MSIMLRQTADLAVQQSAQLFSQETYKQQSDKKGKQTKSSVFKDIHVGNQSISGDFYGAAGVGPVRSDVQAYNGALYGAGNAGYQQFLAGSATGIAPQAVYPALSVDVYNGNNGNFVTPSNFGIPYVDQNFATAAFKWNTAMLFGSPDKQGNKSYQYYNVPNSGTGGQNNRPYIDYSGYRIYVGDGTKITNITYYVFDTNDATNNEQFQSLTNIDPQNLTQLHASASGYEDQMALITQTSGVSPYLRYLTVAKIDYEVEVGYEGLTPLAQAIKYVNGYRVGGLDGHGATPSGNDINFDQTQQLQGTVYYWLVA